jgi:hypothetical protein
MYCQSNTATPQFPGPQQSDFVGQFNGFSNLGLLGDTLYIPVTNAPRVVMPVQG